MTSKIQQNCAYNYQLFKTEYGVRIIDVWYVRINDKHFRTQSLQCYKITVNFVMGSEILHPV
jgi:hypothetical protein